jgi:HEAT repeat protein
MVWHEGPDFTRLVTLARAAPAEVAEMLTSGLTEADPVAAQAMTALAKEGLAPPTAESVLRAAVPSATETFLVRVAQALHTLTTDESWAEPIAAVLTSNAFWGVRVDAARALADFTPTPTLIETLGTAVQDEEYLVRYHAANTLLRFAGRPKDIAAQADLFDLIKGPHEGEPTETDRAQWTTAATRLTADARGDSPAG